MSSALKFVPRSLFQGISVFCNCIFITSSNLFPTSPQALPPLLIPHLSEQSESRHMRHLVKGQRGVCTVFSFHLVLAGNTDAQAKSHHLR